MGCDAITDCEFQISAEDSPYCVSVCDQVIAWSLEQNHVLKTRLDLKTKVMLLFIHVNNYVRVLGLKFLQLC